MALDLVSAPLPPCKRRRLGGSALYADVNHLHHASNLSTACTTQTSHTTSLGVVPPHVDKTPKEDYSRKASPPWQEDDKDGHFNFNLGDNLTSRYKILRKMGEGTFGRVLECWDRDAEGLVAIKVIRSAERYREAAMIEVDVLRTLGKHDKYGSRGCVQIRRWFDYRNHICIVSSTNVWFGSNGEPFLSLSCACQSLVVSIGILFMTQVFEKLGPSLFEFLRTNDYRPFPMDFVRDIGQQLLESVAYMHSLSLIHTDLKPENVLLVSPEYAKVVDWKNSTKHLLYLKRVPKSSRVKLIDFGSTTYDRECNFSVVSTRHYRAPEVILGSGWSYSCDIWSIGCILVELYLGKVLFQTHENLEHLAMMEQTLGPYSSHIFRRLPERAQKYFRHGKRLNWPDRYTTEESIRAVHRLPRLRDLLMEQTDSAAGSLFDLIGHMLKYDPDDRFTAREALKHPFFDHSSRR